MTKKTLLVTIPLAVLLAVYYTFVSGANFSPGLEETREAKKEWKIASLSPGITEMLYAAGLGDNITANTIYCLYPPEAADKPKLGTMMTVNFEYAVSLGINAAVLHTGMDKQKESFKNLGIETVELDMKTIGGILEAFDILGGVFGTEERAAEAKKRMQEEIRKYSRPAEPGRKPRILVAVFRPEGKGSVEKVTAAGRTNFYNEIIELIGAENALTDKRPYPEISREGIISVNPDIIIEISHKKAHARADEWLSLKNTVNAVKNGRVYIAENPAMSIPGPRLPEVIKYFAEAAEGFK